MNKGGFEIDRLCSLCLIIRGGVHIPTVLIHPADITDKGMLDYESLIRIRRGFSLYKETKNNYRKNIYFVSSVQDKLRKDYPSQSELTKKTLTDLGVPPEKIITSNESSSTLDDIRNSFALARFYNLPEPIINVSSWYHIPRIRLMWFLLRKQFGYPKLKYVSAGVANYYWILLEPVKILKLLYLR